MVFCIGLANHLVEPDVFYVSAMKRGQAQPSNAPDISAAAGGFELVIGTKIQRLLSTEQVGKALEPTMHRGLNRNSTCRVVTRSKYRPDAASSVAPAAADSSHQHQTSLAAAAATPDPHAQPLKPSQQQACHMPLSASPYGSSNPLPFSSAKSLAATATPHGSRVRSPVRAAGRLQQAAQPAPAAPSDVEHLVDASSKLVNTRLLRHAGVKQSINFLHQQQQPAMHAASSHGPAAGAVHSGGRSNSSNSNSGHTSSSSSTPTQQPAASTAPPSSGRASGQKRVSFAPGPLSPKFHSRYITDDGHPASEGALAIPVRRLPSSLALDLTRGNVLMLEQLLGADCVLSVTRLKRRVGLLPPIRPPRPHATSSPYSADVLAAEEEQREEEEQAAATAVVQQRKHHHRHKEGAADVNGMAAAAKVPGKAHPVVAKQGNNGGSVGHQR